MTNDGFEMDLKANGGPLQVAAYMTDDPDAVLLQHADEWMYFGVAEAEALVKALEGTADVDENLTAVDARRGMDVPVSVTSCPGAEVYVIASRMSILVTVDRARLREGLQAAIEHLQGATVTA